MEGDIERCRNELGGLNGPGPDTLPEPVEGPAPWGLWFKCGLDGLSEGDLGLS